jgi:hypothetical protein
MGKIYSCDVTTKQEVLEIIAKYFEETNLDIATNPEDDGANAKYDIMWRLVRELKIRVKEAE